MMKIKFLILVFLILIIGLCYVLFFMPSEYEIDQSKTQEMDNLMDEDVISLLSPSLVSEEDVLVLISEATIQQRELELINAASWAALEWSSYIELIRLGEDLFLDSQYDSSYLYYDQANSKGEELLANSNARFNQLLESGLLQLENAQPDAALKNFEIASFIDPENEELLAAINRAINFNTIIRLYEQALELESDGLIQESLVMVDELLLLDPSFEDSFSLRERLLEGLDAINFNSLMTKGYQALNQEDSKNALIFFGEALQIGIDVEIVESAYVQAEQLKIAQKISKGLLDGERYLFDEQWDLAISSFDDALALNPSLSLLIEGREEALQRKLFDEKMKFYIDNPMILLDEGVLAEVKQSLEQADSFYFSEVSLMPEIIETLKDVYQVMTQPIQIKVLSDTLTDVVIIRKADYGKFDFITINLAPGHYIATGIRNGYRDVRINFSVIPGKELAIEVVCTEKI
jgi:hypothetical protein